MLSTANDILFFPWIRGNGRVQIRFSRIAPDGCGGNDFETYQRFEEDDDAIIKYGPQRQHDKEAPLFIKVKTASAERGPALKSRIVCDFQDEDENKSRLYLEFSSEFEERSLTYSVTNRGSEKALFRIPAFRTKWQKLAADIDTDADFRWAADNDIFQCDSDGEPRKHVVRVKVDAEFLEQLVRIDLVSEDGEAIATGFLNLYLPRE